MAEQQADREWILNFEHRLRNHEARLAALEKRSVELDRMKIAIDDHHAKLAAMNPPNPVVGPRSWVCNPEPKPAADVDAMVEDVAEHIATVWRNTGNPPHRTDLRAIMERHVRPAPALTDEERTTIEKMRPHCGATSRWLISTIDRLTGGTP